MGRFVSLFLVLLFSGVASAYGAQSTIPLSAEQKEVALQELLGGRIEKMQRDEEYVIGHGDILSISLYEEGDMAVTPVAIQPKNGATVSGIQVMMDGRIALKEIGDVEVVGLTLAELAEYLKKLYAAIYDNPVVISTLIQSNSLRYTVMGEVAKPGVFQIEHPITIVQALAQAGGFTEWAKKEITVVRNDSKEEYKRHFIGQTLRFNYNEFSKGKAIDKNIILVNGDILIVD